MKTIREFVKTVGATLFMSLFLFFASCSSTNEQKNVDQNKAEETIPTTNEAAPTIDSSTLTEENISQEDKNRDIVNRAISNQFFVNDENGLYTVIKFEPVNEGAPLGAMILSQNKCHYSFTYDIAGNEIKCQFLQSTCGNSSVDKVFYYDLQEEQLYTLIDNQRFVFKPLSN
jgi:hypothetical protein